MTIIPLETSYVSSFSIEIFLPGHIYWWWLNLPILIEYWLHDNAKTNFLFLYRYDVYVCVHA